jgi:hypothetical protein
MRKLPRNGALGRPLGAAARRRRWLALWLQERRRSRGGGVSRAGLIAHWRMDETSGTRFDAHAGLHLAETNTVAGVPGTLGGAASFDRTASEYLWHENTPALASGDVDRESARATATPDPRPGLTAGGRACGRQTSIMRRGYCPFAGPALMAQISGWPWVQSSESSCSTRC